MEQHAKVRKKTWKGDQQLYDLYLAAPLGKKRLSGITREMVRKIHTDVTAGGRHKAVANRVLALISSIFGRAVEWSIIEINPARGVRRNVEVSRDRFLGSDELPRFFASLEQEPNAQLRDFFHVLIFTGARRANVLSMAWADIDVDAAIWRIPMTKSGDPLFVPLVPQALAALARLEKADGATGYVFKGPGKTGHLADPKRAWQRLFDRDELGRIETLIKEAGGDLPAPVDAKTGEAVNENLETRLANARQLAAKMEIEMAGCRMPQARIHDLRRTSGSWQAMTGASLTVIGKGLGHKNVATTAIYSRLQLEPVSRPLKYRSSPDAG
jgi:integrase